MRCNRSNITTKHFCLRVAEPLWVPVLASEEVSAPSRNKVLPDAANTVETRFSLKVLAVGAPRKHQKEVTISQLSNSCWGRKSGAASRFFGTSAPGRLLQWFPTLGLERTLQLLCGVLPQVTTLLQQWRSFREYATTVNKDLGVADPGTLITPEPPHPAVVSIDQPPLLHHATSGHQPNSNSRRTIHSRHLRVRWSP